MFHNQIYVLYLIGIMIATGIIKERDLLSGVYRWLIKTIKDKKVLAFVVSMVAGVLPVPGRIIVSASLLDSVIDNDVDSRDKIGVINYLSTHHYYLWSPLEKTVILPMAMLGISYSAYMYYIWPLLLAYLVYSIVYLWKFVSYDDIQISTPQDTMPIFYAVPLLAGIGFLIVGYDPAMVFGLVAAYYMITTRTYNLKKLYGYLNIKLLAFVSVLLFLSNYIHTYYERMLDSVPVSHIIIVSLFIWVFAFVMGSSSKFAGIVGIVTKIFGVAYLPWFFALEFSAYLLSPMHKCIAITNVYFRTNVKYFDLVIGLLTLVLLVVGCGYSIYLN